MKVTKPEKVLFVAFFLLALAVDQEGPYVDAFLFVAIFAAIIYLPLIAALEMLLVSIWATIRGFDRMRSGGAYPGLRLLFLVAAVGLSVAALPLSLSQSEPWRSIRFSETYDAILISFCVFVLGPIVLIALLVPLWAVGRGVACLIGRDGRGALQYLSVPVLGIGCFFAGRAISDFITVQTIGPAIQRAIRDAERGGTVDRPMIVSKEPPYIVAYNFSGPLLFGPEKYVVYDQVDATAAGESARLGRFLDGGKCIETHAIGEHYYLVVEFF